MRQAEVSKKGKTLTFPSAQPWDRQPWQPALPPDSVAIRHLSCRKLSPFIPHGLGCVPQG